MDNKTITGIILAGGKSLRMGADKGLCDFRGKSLVRYSIDVFKDICKEIIICSNSDEYEQFGYRLVKDEIRDIGPLGGLYTGLKASSNEYNFVISCDMPLMDTSVFKLMFKYAEKYQLVIPKINGFYEPLSAFYHRSVLSSIEKLISHNQRSLQKILAEVNYLALQQDKFPEVLISEYFVNINSSFALNKLAQSIK